MVLSQERSIDRAVVLAGDEDLREGIEYAQDRGVLVTVIGIADRRGGTSQSLELRREADECLALTAAELGALTVAAAVDAVPPLGRPIPPPPGRPPTGTRPIPPPPAMSTPAAKPVDGGQEATRPVPSLEAMATTIVAELGPTLGDADWAALSLTRPGLLPARVDGRVLHTASRTLEQQPLPEETKRALRRLVRAGLDEMNVARLALAGPVPEG